MIFVSYKRHPDAPLAHLIENELRMRGLPTWIDTIEPPGGDWEMQIRDGIERCSAFVVVLTPDLAAASRTVVEDEVALAVRYKKRIVPVLAPGFVWPEAPSAPAWLNAVRAFNGVPASWDYKDAFIDKLVRYCTGHPDGIASESRGSTAPRRWWHLWRR